jgi:hypothetical protein
MSEITKYSYGDPVGQFEGRDFYGGDCFLSNPALFFEVTEETAGRHAETEEEWELFGARLPKEVTILRDIEVGCVTYQALLAAGAAIEACDSCPLLK